MAATLQCAIEHGAVLIPHEALQRYSASAYVFCRGLPEGNADYDCLWLVPVQRFDSLFQFLDVRDEETQNALEFYFSMSFDWTPGGGQENRLIIPQALLEHINAQEGAVLALRCTDAWIELYHPS